MADKKVRISDLKVASSIEGALIEVSVPSGNGYESKKTTLSDYVSFKFVTMTKDEYNALPVKDECTCYLLGEY